MERDQETRARRAAYMWNITRSEKEDIHADERRRSFQNAQKIQRNLALTDKVGLS